MRRLLTLLFVVMLSTVCAAQVPLPYPAGSDPITATSGNVAAGAATATLAKVAARRSFICGFTITSAGSTAAAVVNPTVTGLVTGTLTYVYTSIAGVTLRNGDLNVSFYPCIPASGPNVDIVVSLPSLGAGNTNASVNAYGFRL